MSDKESVLRRWSRRKLEAGKTTHATSGSAGGAAPSRQGKAEFADVDFDALDINSDYARFMLPETPQEVRRRALRKLWESNPAFTEPDGLQDYAKDFTDAATSQGGPVATAYRVGRGFMTDDEFAAWAQLGARRGGGGAQAGSRDEAAGQSDSRTAGQTPEGDPREGSKPPEEGGERGSSNDAHTSSPESAPGLTRAAGDDSYGRKE